MSNAKYSEGVEVDKEHNIIKHSLSKYDDDLYDEEDNIVHKLYRVKRFSLPNKGAKWKIFENDKVIFVLDGLKLTSKERDFLQTVDGVNFLLAQAKVGIKNFSSLKKNIKDKIKNK
jgi:hypothetical protein